MSGSWHRVGNASEVAEGIPLAVSAGGEEIGVYLVEGTLYAVENVCPHAFALLSDGFVEGDRVECPLHQAVFRISTGECLREPADRGLVTYPVKVEDGTILVRVRERRRT